MRHVTSRARAPVTIGLVNNMPDAALLATERQFMRLLEPATQAIEVNIRLFHLPEIARGEAAEMQLRARYEPIEALAKLPRKLAGIDALIVTGCEPVCSNLADEPYWASLARLIDWAKDNTVSTIWSCLAAHAAVLHLDEIERQKLPHKLTGIYEFERMSDHPLLRRIDEPVAVAHSRLNGLQANDLVRHGYELLTHSQRAGVDAFVKTYRSLFVFLQGHPEYEADSLYREYRRDIARYLNGQQQTYPALPENYFDEEAVSALAAFAEEARSARRPDLIERFPAVEPGRPRRTHSQAPALRLFSNWIGYVAEAKARQAHRAREDASV